MARCSRFRSSPTRRSRRAVFWSWIWAPLRPRGAPPGAERRCTESSLVVLDRRPELLKWDLQAPQHIDRLVGLVRHRVGCFGPAGDLVRAEHFGIVPGASADDDHDTAVMALGSPEVVAVVSAYGGRQAQAAPEYIDGRSLAIVFPIEDGARPILRRQ